MVAPTTWSNPPQIPLTALWVSAPPFVFQDLSGAPSGTKSFLTPLAGAKETILTVGPNGTSRDSFELRMQVTTDTQAAATEMVKRFTDVTELFSKMLARDNMQPRADDLSGVLVAGKFTAKDNHVVGLWPIQKSFLESLANSSPVPAPATNKDPELKEKSASKDNVKAKSNFKKAKTPK